MTKHLRTQFVPPLIFDSLFEDFFRTVPESQLYPNSGFPVVDQYFDDDGNAIFEFALAGYKVNDLKVSVEGSKLVVSSEGSEVSESNNKVNRRRIARRKFKNTYTDHENVFDLQNLFASFEDGVLRIEIPKKETAREKVFEIKTKKS